MGFSRLTTTNRLVSSRESEVRGRSGSGGWTAIRISYRPSADSGMPLWQDKLYIALAKAATDATGFYHLPSNRVLELGQQFVI